MTSLPELAMGAAIKLLTMTVFQAAALEELCMNAVLNLEMEEIVFGRLSNAAGT